MRLTRVDAVRFGALEGACLDGIGSGLTVVLGPNESGKSTYTALVRSVLFGFPMGRGKAGDRFYRPVAGDRAARLTFADDTGEWVIDRVEGKFGGRVSVTALRGPERPGLLEELLGEMKEQTYRVVFGFGVDELDDIENGDDPHLTARLYAAGNGLETSPLDVRAALVTEGAELFKPGGRVSTLNQLIAESKDVRDGIRRLEAEAADFAGDQERAERLAVELEPLRRRRDELDVEVRGLERDAQRAKDLAADAAALAERIAELEDDVAAQQATLGASVPDERVLAVAIELDALLDDHSAYRRRIDAAAEFRAAAADAERRLEQLGPLPEGVADSAEARARVEAWATRRAQLEGEIRAGERRVATAEALERELAGAPQGASAATSTGRVVPWVVAAAGGLSAVAGVFLQQWLAVALGALLAVAGVVWALLGRTRPLAADRPADSRRAAADAMAARAETEAARVALQAGEAEWASWLREAGLSGRGADPVAVRALLDTLSMRAQVASELARQRASADAETAAADEWATRLATLAGTFMDVPGRLGAPEVTGLAARARESLTAARAASDRRSRAADALALTQAELARAVTRRGQRLASLSGSAAEHGVDEDDVASHLESAAARAAAELEAARAEYEARAEELATLRGKLDAGGRDAAMALSRQRLEGLQARAGEVADRYATVSLAVKLLDRARERYERERQPEVTRIAGRVFAEMTGGRYAGIRVPLDGGISVVTPGGSARSTAELSTGTAQQLYLALRVGFLSSLDAGRSLPVLMDDVVVNFDAERRAGAAAAIAELASQRQVVFFTCHKETADALCEALPDSVRVSLDRCELRG